MNKRAYDPRPTLSRKHLSNPTRNNLTIWDCLFPADWEYEYNIRSCLQKENGFIICESDIRSVDCELSFETVHRAKARVLATSHKDSSGLAGFEHGINREETRFWVRQRTGRFNLRSAPFEGQEEAEGKGWNRALLFLSQSAIFVFTYYE